MGILTSLFSSRPKAAGYGPANDFWYKPVGTSTNAGVQVTPDSALQIAAVFACIRVRAESLASLPLKLYRRLAGGGKEPASDHAIYDLLHYQPNRWQTSYEWRLMLQAHLDLRGNAYCEILPGPRGAVDQLIPLHPDRVKPYQTGRYTINYEVKSADNTVKTRTLSQDQVFHLRGLSCDGIVGLSPIALARETIGRAVALQEHGSTLFANGARPGGILKHPGVLKPEARRNLRESWERTHGGSANAGRTAILEEGMDWVSVGMTSEDSQFIQSEEFSVVEICRIFRVPPYKIGHMVSGTVSYASVEQQAIDFVTDSLRPSAVNWEQALRRDVVVEDETYFAEFLFDALLRGDAQSRSLALQTQFMNGNLTNDEWREIENRNPLPDGHGKKFYVPMNITPVENLANSQMSPAEAPEMVNSGAGNLLNRVAVDVTAGKMSIDVARVLVRLAFPGLAQEDADDFFSKLEGASPSPSAAPVEEPPASEPDPTESMDGGQEQNQAAMFAPLIADAAQRIASAELRELAKRADKAAEDRERFNGWAEDHYIAHRHYVAKTLTPLAASWKATSGFSLDVEKLSGTYTLDALKAVCDGDPVGLLMAWEQTRADWLAGQIREEFERCRTA